MTELFQQKYRTKSARCPNWDYGSNAAYFITICTAHRIFFFGEVVNRKIQLFEIGKLAQKFWLEIPNHFPFVELNAFVVMPNHVHGILIINKTPDDKCGAMRRDVALQRLYHETNKTTGNGETNKNQFMAKISPKPGTVSTIIRSYKSVVTKHAHKINPDFAWQERFHDHIIRDNASFGRIRNYIIKNPVKWENDKFYFPGKTDAKI